MALVLAVKAGQSESVVDSVPHRVRRRLRRDRREVCAGRRSRLVGAVWAVAVIVVDSEGWNADGRIADASERLGVFVVFGDCRVWSANVSTQLVFGSGIGSHVQSGLTPRGLPLSDAAKAKAADSRHKSAAAPFILREMVQGRSGRSGRKER